jgi:hypothetical protein
MTIEDFCSNVANWLAGLNNRCTPAAYAASSGFKRGLGWLAERFANAAVWS